jgi:hypothetical protein
MTQRKGKRKDVENTASGLEDTGSSCPFDAGYDRSPEGKQMRADELRATIPAEVAAQVRGLIVSELGLCIAKFAAMTTKPKVDIQLDEAVYRLANGHPLGMLSACIEFRDGAKLNFETMRFIKFTPAPSTSRRKGKGV